MSIISFRGFGGILEAGLFGIYLVYFLFDSCGKRQMPRAFSLKGRLLETLYSFGFSPLLSCVWMFFSNTFVGTPLNLILLDQNHV